jgi:biotin carboxyl carrier protein
MEIELMKTVATPELGEIPIDYDSQAGLLKVGAITYHCQKDHVIINDRRVPFWVHRQGQSVSVWLDGEVYTYELADPRQRESNRGSAAAAGGAVKAQMPGKVLQVSVMVGDQVQLGDNLLLMESMKMELALDAPVAGTVKKVEVRPEQMVSQGDLLVEIEEE